LEANEILNERIRELMDSGRLAEAQAVCIETFPEPTEARAALLAEILQRSRERPELAIPAAYHQWYYDSVVWQNIQWLGVPIFKSPMDLWSYQEIICELRPTLVIEFGTYKGGSALFFRNILDMAGIDAEVITVDILDAVHPIACAKEGIRFIQDSSTSPSVRELLVAAIAQRPGKIFAILDSDHRAEHVYAEMLELRDLLSPGDYVVVEDGNINGHPVLPNWPRVHSKLSNGTFESSPTIIDPIPPAN
jgi:cephalosporin hydroxylase